MTWKCYRFCHFAEYDNWMRHCELHRDYSCLRLTLQKEMAWFLLHEKVLLIILPLHHHFALPESYGVLLCPYCDALLKNIYLSFIWLHWLWVSAQDSVGQALGFSVVADGPALASQHVGSYFPAPEVSNPCIGRHILATGPPGSPYDALLFHSSRSIKIWSGRMPDFPRWQVHTHNKGSSRALSSLNQCF